MPRRGDDKTLELFDWEPTSVEVSFSDEIKALSSIGAGRISRAVGATMTDNSKKREAIQEKMQDILGQKVSLHMLNNWASEAKEDHNISLRHAFGLLHATNDPRILSLGLEGSEFAIIPRKYLNNIKDVMIRDKIAELTGELKIVTRQRKEGLS